MKNILLSIGFSLVIGTISAQQDKQYTMFFATMSQINPAAAGYFQGDYHLFTNFRQQWNPVSSQPYQTISASVDTRLFEQSLNGFMGAGINFYNDVAGDSRYTVNQISVPINYAIQINKLNHLSFGLSPGFYQRSISTANLTWDNQWSGVAFDQSVNSNEGLLNQNLSISKFDIGAGAYWQGELNKYSWIGAGISAHHLTKERINVFGEDNRLYRRMNVNLHGSFSQKNSNLTVKPNLMAFFQGPNSSYVIGTGFDIMLRGSSLITGYYDRTSIEFGVYSRIKDAIMFNTIFHWSGLSVGAAFDFNVSSLSSASNGFGAMEFFLAYKIKNPRGLGAPSIH